VSDRYLQELEQALRRRRVPARRRRRFLAEAADHMACDSEAAATFGDPELLAQQVAAMEQPRRVRLLSAVLVGTILAFVVPLYGIPENTLPPAPPQGLPASVEWKLDWAIALYVAALVLAALAFAVSWARPRLTKWPALLAVGAVVASVALGSAAAAEWPVGGSTALAAVVPTAVALVCVAALATARLASAAWPRQSI
jgi:peptidoglycan/LPS O-acetylase OafA/YrhL